MKFFLKMLSFIIVFSIVLSMMSFNLIDVEAAYENCLLNGDFESGTTDGWITSSGSAEVKPEAARSGGYGVHITHDENTKSTDRVFKQTHDFKAGEWYYLCGYIKPLEDTGGQIATVRLCTVDSENAFVGEQRDGSACPTMSNWTKLENIAYVTQDCTSDFYIRVGYDTSDYAYDYYADDFKLCKISLNQTENLPTSGKLIINGPEDMNLSENNVVFTNSGIIGAVEYNNKSAVWEITYYEMEANAENSIRLPVDVSDGQMDIVLDFKTGSGFVSCNILSFTDKDCDFENSAVGTKVTETENAYASVIGNANYINGGTFTVAYGSGALPAYSGKQYLQYTGRNNDVPQPSSHRFNNVTGLKMNKTYIISYYARLADSEDSVAASVFVSGANLDKNIYKIANVTKNSVSLTSQWQRVTACVTIVSNTERDETVIGVDKGIHIGASFTGTADVHIDKYEIREAGALSYNKNVNASITISDENYSAKVYTLVFDVADRYADTDIYFAAIKYNNSGSISDMKIISTSMSNSFKTLQLSGITDDYTIYIWNDDYKPLIVGMPAQWLKNGR